MWGEDVVSEGGVGQDIASPIWTSTARTDALTGGLLESGISISRPSCTIRGERLTARQFGEYEALSGRYISAPIWWRLATRRNGPGWTRSNVAGSSIGKREARADARADLGSGLIGATRR